jgi:hypothetical protein
MTGPIRTRIVGHGTEDPEQLLANPQNFRRHPGPQLEALRGSLRELGWVKGVLVNRTTGHVIDGHARIEEAMRQKEEAIPVDYVELTLEEERLALAVLDPISEMATRDEAQLQDLLADINTDDPGLKALLEELDRGKTADEDNEKKTGTLAARFGIPPFSVLDARAGYWQDRKRAWIALGIESEFGRPADLGGFEGAIERREALGRKDQLTWSGNITDPDHYRRKEGKRPPLPAGRKDNLTFVKGDRDKESMDDTSKRILGVGAGTSIFDPVLCELAYRWFCPPGGTVLDPFGGGSVRGVVAGMLGRAYLGIDLRPEQIAANERQWEAIDAAEAGTEDAGPKDDEGK